MKYEQIRKILSKNVAELVERDSMMKKLEGSRKLIVKIGMDPTKPDLHLGHAVALRKLKEFQNLNHIIVFLIGDFTAKIGDPSGRDTTRPVLTEKEIEANSKTYLEQVGKVLDLKKCQIRKNSEWFSKMNFKDILQFISKVTVSQVIEREDFKNRLKEGHDLGLHELIYPLMQGYDSVELHSDVELGGTDQYFNLLMGRVLQKRYQQKPQDIMTVPLLVGTDGVKKMSKSYHNYIGLNENPESQFGKIMSIPDNLIENYLELVTDFSEIKIKKFKDDLKKGVNPRDIKELIAENVVKIYHSPALAAEAKQNFDRVFRQGKLPEKIRQIEFTGEEVCLVEALLTSNLASSNSQAQRLISQGGVKIDGAIEKDQRRIICLKKPVVVSVGKLNYVRISGGTKAKD